MVVTAHLLLLEVEGQPGQKQLLRDDQRVRRIAVLEIEVLIEEIANLEGEEAKPIREAVAQRSIDSPERVLSRENNPSRVGKFTILVHISPPRALAKSPEG